LRIRSWRVASSINTICCSAFADGGGGARTLIDQGPCGDKAKPFPELERARAARRKALGRTD
jgi:hypothetical protein